MSASNIEWTDETWNPLTGCTRVSPGCDHCYAVRMTRRLAGMGQTKYAGLTTRKHFNGKVKTHDDELRRPFHWRRPRMVFVNSMSDLFHKDVPETFIVKVFATMWDCQWHTFQVLTKRPERMLELMSSQTFVDDVGIAAWHQLNQIDAVKAALVTDAEIVTDLRSIWPLPNVWLGTSIETVDYLKRIERLRDVPAAVHFLSIEPLLEPLPSIDLSGIGWVIVGGESGPGARRMHPVWARLIRSQCLANGVPFFFKQWGKWLPGVVQPGLWIDFQNGELGAHSRHGIFDAAGNRLDESRIQPGKTVYTPVGKKKAGRLLDGREWNGMPSFERY